MSTISPSQLDAFVAFVDDECSGDLLDPRVNARFAPFEVVFETRVDQTVSPFAPAYFDAQLALYREIAGRDLDQASGELHPVDVPALVHAPNPQGIADVAHVAENVRAVASMLSIANLPGRARVLDMGAGHGLSSEIYAFCSARVRAVDIDPALSELSRLRAAQRSLDIERAVMNFDSLASLDDDSHDAAFFFQSLHHALRPWRLIADLKNKLTERGVIAFCGEPIVDDPWRHWGLRLDMESVYVARKYGWFESGWSRDFIAECFQRSGMTLTFLTGGHLGGLIGVATRTPARRQEVITRAAMLGHAASEAPRADATPTRFFSQIGRLTQHNSVGSVIRAESDHSGGFLCFGPYAPLAAGRYEVEFLLTLLAPAPGVSADASQAVDVDVTSATGTATHARETFRLARGENRRIVRLAFVLAADVAQIETRAYVPDAGAVWELSLPTFRRLPE